MRDKVLIQLEGSKEFTIVPKDEVPDNYVRVLVQDGAESYPAYVPLAEISIYKSEKRPLSAAFQRKAEGVWSMLEPVMATNREEWIAGFEHDSTPETELLIWEKIAAAYTSLLATFPDLKTDNGMPVHQFDVNIRRMIKDEMFAILVECSINDPGDIANFPQKRILSNESVHQVAIAYSRVVENRTVL